MKKELSAHELVALSITFKALQKLPGNPVAVPTIVRRIESTTGENERTVKLLVLYRCVATGEQYLANVRAELRKSSVTVMVDAETELVYRMWFPESAFVATDYELDTGSHVSEHVMTGPGGGLQSNFILTIHTGEVRSLLLKR